MPIYDDAALRNPLDVTIARLVRERRRACALSFEQLASALRIELRDYVDREYGRVPFSAAELGTVGLILGVDLHREIETSRGAGLGLG